MKTTHFYSHMDSFNHESESVTATINYLIQQFKPRAHEKLDIMELNHEIDGDNEYAFLLNFFHDTEGEDMTEEVEVYINDLEQFQETSDYAISAKYDFTHKNHLILLTFVK